ncbi:MAG: XTP/dITP diphosphatase [Nitrospira sp.]|nr:XTP/dITP diphosphatase [Nitrospira sp.]
MDLVLATRNLNKSREISAFLEDLEHRILTLEDFPLVPEVVEDGGTYEANAMKKALAASKYTGKMSLADDTGLEVDALQGQPGLFSARFAGEDVTYADNRRKLLSLMKDVPPRQRTARFRCVMVLAMQEGKTQTVEGVVEGSITLEERGEGGFGYDPVFYLPEAGKTLAQLTFEEKNKVSHRARALEKIREILLNGV